MSLSSRISITFEILKHTPFCRPNTPLHKRNVAISQSNH